MQHESPGRRRKPQVPPPPLRHADESLEGDAILAEFPGDAGLILWKTHRSVTLWAAAKPAERRKLFPADTLEPRMRWIEGTLELEGTRDALLRLAEMLRGGAREGQVVEALQEVEGWAEARGGPRTALEFAQLAALTAPGVAAHAEVVARRARNLAQYVRAESWYRQGVYLGRTSADWFTYVKCHVGMAITHFSVGRYPAAIRALERGLRSAERHSVRELIPLLYHERAVVAIRTDRFSETTYYVDKALGVYDPQHPRLPSLAHDVGVYWMKRGYFDEARRIFLALPDTYGDSTDRLARASSLARAAGALADEPLFERSVGWVEALLADPATSSRASTALIDVARGAVSLRRTELAHQMAERALSLASARSESEQQLEAESILCQTDTAVSLPAPSGGAPTRAERLTSELLSLLVS